jgi:uronate dehydrogenase
MIHFNRLLLTGAAGDLGSHLRKSLAPCTSNLRLTDRMEMAGAKEGEELVQADLGDFDSVLEMTREVDAIVHFGGASRERVWADVLNSTISGSYNIYEAARRNGVKRIVYASSIHAVGFTPVEDVPDTRTRHRPDTLYGLSKCFTEDLASLYFDKYGIETVALRICSCFTKPEERRQLWSWLSYDDCSRLVISALSAPRVGFSVIYGTSDNAERAVSNVHATHIGYKPQDSADPYREAVEASTARPDPHNPDVKYVGGWFTSLGHPDDDAA